MLLAIARAPIREAQKLSPRLLLSRVCLLLFAFLCIASPMTCVINDRMSDSRRAGSKDKRLRKSVQTVCPLIKRP